MDNLPDFMKYKDKFTDSGLSRKYQELLRALALSWCMWL